MYADQVFTTKKAATAAKKAAKEKAQEKAQSKVTKEQLNRNQKALTKKAAKNSVHAYTLKERRAAWGKEFKCTEGAIKALYNTSKKEFAFIRKYPKAKVFALVDKINEEQGIGMEYTTKRGTFIRKPSIDIVLRWFHANEANLKELCKK